MKLKSFIQYSKRNIFEPKIKERTVNNIDSYFNFASFLKKKMIYNENYLKGIFYINIR